MNSAQRIAETLDRHLAEKTEIVVFGTAAVMLDSRYSQHLIARLTNDVDIIIPAERELQMDANELESEGLYISHIFPERQVTPTPEWQRHTVRWTHPAAKAQYLAASDS